MHAKRFVVVVLLCLVSAVATFADAIVDPDSKLLGALDPSALTALEALNMHVQLVENGVLIATEEENRNGRQQQPLSFNPWTLSGGALAAKAASLGYIGLFDDTLMRLWLQKILGDDRPAAEAHSSSAGGGAA